MKSRCGGKEKLLSFSSYPRVGIAAARETCTLAKVILSSDEDPAKEQSDADPDAGRTYLAVATIWHDNRTSSLDLAHAQRFWSRLERDVFAEAGQEPIDEIGPLLILKIVCTIEERGALDISRRAKQGVGQVFQFAIDCGLATRARLCGALKPRPRVKHKGVLGLAVQNTLILKGFFGSFRQVRDAVDAAVSARS